MNAAIAKSVKYLATTNTGKKILKYLVIAIVGLCFVGVAIIAAPIIAVTAPLTWFLSDSNKTAVTSNCIQLMVEYRNNMNATIRDKKKSENGVGVKISYPSLSLMIAYNNMLNLDEYEKTDEADISLDIDRDKTFEFFNTVVIYSNDNGIITSTIKDITTIASETFSDNADRERFINYYSLLSGTDIDSQVPETKFTDFEYKDGGIPLPYFCQYDSAWKDHAYGSSTIGSSGCGITSLAMVISGLTGKDVYPTELADWGGSQYYIPGSGSSWAIMEAAAQKYGLKVENLSRNDPDRIIDALGFNQPVIVSMSAGHFTRGGHFIVLRGLDTGGRVMVSDPASEERSNQSWDFSLILTESSTLSDYCFWSFSK